MTGPTPIWLGASAVATLPVTEAADALERALRNGLDPAAGPARSSVPVPGGQLFLMPAAADVGFGVKVLSLAPANPDRGLPRIQAVYALFDPDTLAPVAMLDGTALTTLRTPAVSLVAIRRLAVPDASRLVVFGTGPQAAAHIEAVRAVRPIVDVAVVGRDPGRTDAFVRQQRAAGVPVRMAAQDAVGRADIVVCATTAGEPLFPGGLPPRSACVVAIGTHEPSRRELDPALLSRARVVVEDVGTALREAGDVVLAVSEGALDPAALHTLADLVAADPLGPSTADQPGDGRPAVFKSVGMAWQDLVVAAEVHRRRVEPSRWPPAG
jgi:ornithine cyclodeaminase/alanine dehydrogenase-like protein (mu-crystallin family)